jgi:hypothetical protein
MNLCKNFTNQVDRDSCFLAYSEIESEVYVCEEIKDEKLKNGCYKSMALRNENGELCDKLSLLNKNECYCEVSYKLKDFNSKLELINKIENLTYMGVIREFSYICINEVVEKTGNKELCDKIKNVKIKAKCKVGK